MSEKGQANTNAVVAIILGVLSIILFPLGWLLGIIGLIYGKRSLREIQQTGENGKNLAVAGKICSIVGIVLGLVFILLIIAGLVLFTFRVV